MKPTLQLKIGQQLTMTPQLQQAIRLLQLSTIDLQQEIQETIESNPMLELAEGEDGRGDQERVELNGEHYGTQNGDASNTENLSTHDTATHDTAAKETTSSDDAINSNDDWGNDIPSELPVDSAWDDIYQDLPTNYQASGDFPFGVESNTASGTSLQDHLRWQLNLTPMSDLDRMIADTIIDSIKPDGYLECDLETMLASANDQAQAAGLRSEELIELDEVEAVLRRLQHFDPVGVCARDLGECLYIQLNQLDPQTAWLDQAKTLVSQHIALLGSRDYNQLMRRTKLKEHELQEVLRLIRGLHPRPGDVISESEPEYVIPDVMVKKVNGRWRVELNPDVIPKVHINATYAALIRRADTSSDNTYMRNHLQEARWFLKSIQSRNETLLKVASKIVEIQQDFLEYGEEAMKPLVLHDIAKNVEMHESTISRVTTQKYMHTPRGIFELKYFFSSHVDTQSGGACSSTAIRAIIKKLVAAEQPNKPLSDSKIADILGEQGIQVARRTIAKYRESLLIPPSNERKRLV